MATAYKFNLLERKKSAFIAVAVDFLNQYIRYILVATELVVLGVFFVKILLDQKIVDLKEGIDQKNQIIIAAAPLIQNNNRMAKKITEIETLLNNQKSTYALFTTVLDNVPSSIRIESFALENGKVNVSGATYNAIDIKKYEKRLKKILGKNSVVIKRVTIDAGKYTFDVQIKT
ncbi:hypothetical protein COU88_04815 [Candidatus Roizmanbacteria bacterium CG10_big_fil_rev_8_21_14_0_10_39_6]|uniref:Uncharacterized protein n=1 Tax=Candidatus Roizmanbacteria bacterium CG10_big_fil_rev_8_21_14_0_10_39_6 TaxID=1974853 RepID=A0A2M8KRC9_9BACT|nr:MAG: hypothetical protein COU88_04815 [Candidatus Roizmanbacteria bacterium CG10_big_fil_rev_8_21_14_0_10_39_6]